MNNRLFKHKIIATFLGVTMTMALSVPVSAADSADDPIRVGIFMTFTGSNAAGGQLEFEGIQAAQNARPEVLGREIEFVIADNKSDDVEAVTAASSLVSAGCSIVLGSPGSSYCIAAAPIFEEAGIPVIGTTATNPLVTQGNDCYFRPCYTDDFQGAAMAQFAAKDLEAKTAGIITDVTDTYCIGARKYFVETFGEENIVADVRYNKGDQDFSAQLNAIREANPDVVFCPTQYTEAALIQIQAHQMGYYPQFLAIDSWEVQPMIDIGGKDVEGSLFTCFFVAGDNPSPTVQKYLDDYDAMFPGQNPKGSGTALGYDSYNIALDAIEIAGTTDSEALMEALEENEFDCVTGLIRFDEEHDAIKDSAYIKTIKDGKFVYYALAQLDPIS
ncbi:MAG: ABC transporter substrate-binding protein [Lachnospiraceae bacterium]|nr:ABC transporter substrate-binding protein [Lachnospiraceae bacterium]